MIRINERFSIERDQYGWNLYETYMGQNEAGEPVERTRKTFPGRLWVALHRIVESCGDSAGNVAELRDEIRLTVAQFKEATKDIR